MGGVLPLPARLVIPGKLRLEEKLLRILEALTTEPLRKGATHTDLMKGTDLPAATLNRSLTVLHDAGYIRAVDSTSNHRSRLYYLTDPGRDALDIAFEERSESWSGRTVEELGRGWNWQVASSAYAQHSKAVLPGSSNTSSTNPPFPPLGGEGGGEGVTKVLPAGQDAYASQVKGFRALEFPEPEDEPSFAEPAHLPVAFTPGVNWDYLRKAFAARDIGNIQTHCALRRADFDTVLAQLESEQ